MYRLIQAALYIYSLYDNWLQFFRALRKTFPHGLNYFSPFCSRVAVLRERRNSKKLNAYTIFTIKFRMCEREMLIVSVTRKASGICIWHATVLESGFREWMELLFSHSFPQSFPCPGDRKKWFASRLLLFRKTAHKTEINLLAMYLAGGAVVWCVCLCVTAKWTKAMPDHKLYVCAFVFRSTWTMCQFRFVPCLSFSNKMFNVGR